MSAWVAETLFATTILMALVLGVRPFVRRLFGAGAAYALWLGPVLSLFLPEIARPSTFVGAVVPMDVVFATAPALPASVGWLLWIWAAGALLFLLRLVVGYRRFLARALDGASRVNGDGDGDGVDTLITDAVEGPVAAGLTTRRIFLPRDFETRFTDAERDLALRHERAHLERGDLFANAAALFVLALHWFNPLAYFAYRAFREDQELSCDAAVIAAAGAEARAAYAAAMVKSARGAAAPATACPMSRRSTLKRRLTMIKTHKTSRYAKAGSLASLALVAIAGATLTATSGIAAEAVVSTQTVVIKRVASRGEGDAVIGKEIENRCGSAAQIAEAKKSLSAALSRPGKPVRTVTLDCSEKTATPAERAAMLEKAMANISFSSDIKPEQREKVLSALKEELSEARAKK